MNYLCQRKKIDMIKAINPKGKIAFFSEKVWSMMPPQKNGWEIITDERPVNVPDMIREFQQKKKGEDVTAEESIVPHKIVEIKFPPSEPEITEDAMRDFLTEKGIPFHHKLGYAKLKALYDDHSK